MISTSLVLFAAILHTEASSRFFVYTLSVPFLDDQYVPFPLDTCVNYEIYTTGILNIVVHYNYAKFTCNTANDQITMTKYGEDDDCSSNGNIDGTYNNDFNRTGDLYSFNCIGEDNYATNHVYQKDSSCCGSSYTVSNVATNVCVRSAANDGTFSMAECDGNTTVSYKYNVSDCNSANKPSMAAGTNYEYECLSIANQFTPIYTRMDKCVVNGDIISESGYCHTTTPAPTVPSQSPTVRPSQMPSVSPSVSPTTAMEATVIGNISLMNSLVIGAVILLVLLIGIGAYCVVRKRKLGNANGVGLIHDEYEQRQFPVPIAMDNVDSGHGIDIVEPFGMENIIAGGEVVSDDGQVIVGTADEISIINFDEPPR